MSSGTNPSSNPGSQDPYLALGIEPGASYDEVQKARDKKISEVENDPILKAKVEASFDALLMDSLKLRQLGKVSSEAIQASNRENSKKNEVGNGNLLTRLKSFDFQTSTTKEQSILPTFSIPDGEI